MDGGVTEMETEQVWGVTEVHFGKCQDCSGCGTSTMSQRPGDLQISALDYGTNLSH